MNFETKLAALSERAENYLRREIRNSSFAEWIKEFPLYIQDELLLSLTAEQQEKLIRRYEIVKQRMDVDFLRKILRQRNLNPSLIEPGRKISYLFQGLVDIEAWDSIYPLAVLSMDAPLSYHLLPPALQTPYLLTELLSEKWISEWIKKSIPSIDEQMDNRLFPLQISYTLCIDRYGVAKKEKFSPKQKAYLYTWDENKPSNLLRLLYLHEVGMLPSESSPGEIGYQILGEVERLITTTSTD